jgi:hypothetical protein
MQRGTKRIVFLNTSILTSEGKFNYHKATLEQIEIILQGEHKNTPRLSAVDHEATAAIFSKLTGETIPVNRIQYKQEFSDLCIILKLKGRPPEGKILTRHEIEEIGYEFGILYKIVSI